LGTKQGHLYYQLQPWGRGTSDQEYLLWPTPIASDGIAWKYTRKADVGRSVRMALTNKPGIRRGQKRVVYYLALLEYSPIQASEFIETMMGLPKGWTDLSHSEMP